MILPSTYYGTLALMILTMLCWGSWANTFKLAGKWRFELYYFDYAIGVMLAALIAAFTLGTLGFDGFSFRDDLLHASKKQDIYGFLAGVIFNLANMLLVAAISVSGMAVAFPIGIGLALVIGVIWSYAINPHGNPAMLFSGAALITVAIVLNSQAYKQYKLNSLDHLVRTGQVKSTRKIVSIKGVFLALVSGVLMGCFFPLVELGKQGDTGLGPYSIAVVFALGVFLSTFLFQSVFHEPAHLGTATRNFRVFQGQHSPAHTRHCGGSNLVYRNHRQLRCGQRRRKSGRGAGCELRSGTRRYFGECALGIVRLERVQGRAFKGGCHAGLDACLLCNWAGDDFSGAAGGPLTRYLRVQCLANLFE